jgi:hypothetical protein
MQKGPVVRIKVVDHLLRKHKALSSTLTIIKKKSSKEDFDTL